MAKSLSQMLGINTMLKYVETPFGGVDSSPLPSSLFTLRVPVQGQTARWNQTANTRNVAPTNMSGAPARAVGLQEIKQREATCISAFNEMTHKADTWRNLVSLDTGLQDLGASWVDYQVREFNRLHDNLRISAVCSALFKGHIYTDANGDLLPTSSSNFVDVDLQVPSTNIGALSTLTALPSTASWATTSTDILGQLEGIRKLAQQYSGRPIRYIFYGVNILNYLALNTAISNILHSNTPLATAFAQNQIPTAFGMNGGDSRGGGTGPRVDWISAATLGFKDAGGTFRYWCGADQIVCIPEPDMGWYNLQEGTFMVPRALTLPQNPGPDLFQEVRGRFSYCEIKTNPPGVTQYMGDTFLPCFTDPNAIFNITTTIA